MSRVKFRRRNYFINREFQGRTIFHYFLLVLAGSILFSMIFSFFSSNTISIVYEDYHLRLGTTPNILMEKLFSAQWSFIVICGAAVILVTLFLTHRSAGPFYRFEKSLDAMISGDLSLDIHLREKDEGKGIAKKINEFNRLLARRLTAMEALNNEIHDLASAQADADDTLARILDNTEKINALINEFVFTRQS